MIECKICNKEFKNTKELSDHLKTEHSEISKLEYLMNYHFDSKIGKCLNCGKQVKYISFSKYNIYCCKKCRQEYEHKHPEMMQALELKRKQTCLKKYGAESSSANKETIEKIKKTKLEKYGDSNYNNIEKCKETKLERYGDSNYNNFDSAKQTNLKKYGAEYTFKSDLVKQKIKETNLERYGVENPNQCDLIKEKIKETNLERYGVECVLQLESVRDLAKKTNLKKYGVEYPIQTDLIKEKRIKSNLEKYGVEYPIQTPEVANLTKSTNLERYGTEYTFQSDIIKEKSKQTCLEKYGVKYPAQSDLIKEKSKSTNLERYGTEYTFQSDIIKEKSKSTNLERYGTEYTFQSDIIKEKSKQTYLKKYGVDHPSKSEIVKLKIYNTHKRNNSFNTSEPELKLLKLLQDKFGFNDIEYQYKSSQYPFVCDFYVKSLDLYIELQGSWTHGGVPYDFTNPDHIKKLQIWKSKNTKFYNNAINVWTIRDPLKRQTAKDSNLNYIEVFDSKTFKELEFLFKDSNLNNE